MDPNANLREQLDIAGHDYTDKETNELSLDEMEQIHRDLLRLQDLVLGLDQWISKGGFTPKKWNILVHSEGNPDGADEDFPDGSVEVSCEKFKKLYAALQLAEKIANMTTEEEMDEGGSSDDFVDTVNALIEESRKLTGIDPEHERLYCTQCGMNFDDCGHEAH